MYSIVVFSFDSSSCNACSLTPVDPEVAWVESTPAGPEATRVPTTAGHNVPPFIVGPENPKDESVDIVKVLLDAVDGAANGSP